MKTYEKYLLTEKVTATKMLRKIEHHIKTATTTADVHVASQMIVRFIKQNGKLWTDDVSNKIISLLNKAKAKIGSDA